MDGIIAIHLVAAVRVIVADTIADAHGDLHRIGTVSAGIVVPAAAARVEFATVERQNCAIGGSRRGGAAFTGEDSHLLDRTHWPAARECGKAKAIPHDRFGIEFGTHLLLILDGRCRCLDDIDFGGGCLDL